MTTVNGIKEYWLHLYMKKMITEMFVGEKKHIHTRSFHHLIKEGFAHLVDENHLMGLDPFDRTKFNRRKRNIKKDNKNPVKR